MKADKNDIKAIVKMPDVLSALGMRHDHSRIPCPLQRHRSRYTFAIQPDFWVCHACGQGGDIFKLVQIVNNCTFTEALDWICRAFNIPNDGAPDPAFNERIKERRRAEKQQQRDREYQSYVWRRVCEYKLWLEEQERTQLVVNHIAWCDRLLDRMEEGEKLFAGKNVDEQLRGMWQQFRLDA